MKLKHLQAERTRHGVVIYYFRRGRGARRIRLPDVGSPDFRKHYDAAMAGDPIPFVRELPTARESFRKQEIELTATLAVQRARARANERGLAFDLTVDWAIEQIEASNFRCPLTHVPFCTNKPVQSSIHPYRPSIDRIRPGQGYTTDNCRVVIAAVNMMLNDWGTAVFERVIEGYRWTKNAKLRGALVPNEKSRLSLTDEKAQYIQACANTNGGHGGT